MLITITGPTCSGKSTLEKAFTRRVNAQRLISFTTRSPRSGEQEGEDYRFLKSAPDDKDLIEHVVINGTHYGLTEWEVSKAKKDLCVVVVNPEGIHHLKKYCEDNGVKIFSVYLFQKEEVLIKRFLSRFKSDTISSLDYSAMRFQKMLEEQDTWHNEAEYDWYLTGEDLSQLVDELKECIERL